MISHQLSVGFRWLFSWFSAKPKFRIVPKDDQNPAVAWCESAARRESADNPPVHVKGRHSVSASLTSGGQDNRADQRKLGSQDDFQVAGFFLGLTGWLWIQPALSLDEGNNLKYFCKMLRSSHFVLDHLQIGKSHLGDPCGMSFWTGNQVIPLISMLRPVLGYTS